MSQVLAAFEGFGPTSFTDIVCQQAPYFQSIQPHISALQPQRAEANIPFRKEITNHLGTVHAIAMCNLAELVAGLMTDVTIPEGARWIPQSMTVNYLAKAETGVHAIADGSQVDWQNAGEKVVTVDIFDEEEKKVFTAEITMNVKLA